MQPILGDGAIPAGSGGYRRRMEAHRAFQRGINPEKGGLKMVKGRFCVDVMCYELM